MFDQDPDDNVQKAGVVPPENLPLAEPEDLFQSTEDEQVIESVPEERIATASAPSAVDAGILRPKIGGSDQEPAFLPPAMSSDNPPSDFDQYKIEEPSFFRTILLVVGTILLVGGLSFGGWWAYTTYVSPAGEEEPVEEEIEVPGELEPEPEPTPEEEGTEGEQFDDRILFGDIKDTDGDGLEDAEEQSLKTRVDSVDSDEDELTDYEEVKIWKTNPLEKDTDGDTFVDGQEVKNGYNPAGMGRILEIPKNETELDELSSSTSSLEEAVRVNSTSSTEDEVLVTTCGADLACAVAAAQKCQEASVRYTTTADLSSFGVTQKITLYIAVRPPLVQNTCEFLVRTESIETTYASSVPLESQTEQELSARDLEGREGRCKLPPAKIAALFTAWRKSTPEAKDFPVANCAGSFFEKPIF